MAEWATPPMFAHDNAVENLVIFATLVLILAQLDYSTKWTALACAVYFPAGVAHIIVYTLGLPYFAPSPSPSASWLRRCWRWRSSGLSENLSALPSCIRRSSRRDGTGQLKI